MTEEGPVRLGMVGLDTSHVPEFTRLINGPSQVAPGGRVRIVAALPAGNPEFPLSRDRVEGYTEAVRNLGVRLVSSLEELLEQVDGVMVQSVDGGQHLAQAAPVFAAGKPIFIDKPLAGSLRDVLEIAALGDRYRVPWFTASSLRYTGGFPELRVDRRLDRILGCDVYGPCRTVPGHPDLFWYGVHGVDLLYSLLGCGCQTVSAVRTEHTEHVTGLWSAGRVGTFRGLRGAPVETGWGVTVSGCSAVVQTARTYDYEPLVREIVQFFLSGIAPVSPAEMVEVFAFMEAAEESCRRGGSSVALTEVVEHLRAAAGRR